MTLLNTTVKYTIDADAVSTFFNSKFDICKGIYSFIIMSTATNTIKMWDHILTA